MEHIISKRIAELALKSMLYEVVTVPKPGLVDSSNNGSHEDMDVFTFIDSSISLYPYMYRCSRLGYSCKTNDPGELFQHLRNIGIEAEEEMFSVTKGINTQKGLIFILGIICACAAIQMSSEKKINIDKLCCLSSNMVQGIVDRELISLDKTKELAQWTAGQRIYLEHGITGIRGEVEKGFPTIRKYGLPNLNNYIDRGFSMNYVFVNTLLHIMLRVEDTNVIWRGGIEALELMQNSAKEALDLGGITTKEGKKAIEEMDKLFIKKNISPGGSADLLAATIMFYLLDREFN